MLVNEHDLNRALEARAKAIEMRVAVLGDMVSTDDSTMPTLAIVDVSFDTETLAIVEDKLTKDGDASLEWDHKRDWSPYCGR